MTFSTATAVTGTGRSFEIKVLIYLGTTKIIIEKTYYIL